MKRASWTSRRQPVAFRIFPGYAGRVIDFTKETPLSLAAVAKRFGVAIETVRRWARGVGGLRLETAKLGGKRFTSLEAIQRFSHQGTKQKRLPFAQARESEEELRPMFEEGSKARAGKSRSHKRKPAR